MSIVNFDQSLDNFFARYFGRSFQSTSHFLKCTLYAIYVVNSTLQKKVGNHMLQKKF